MVADGVFEFRMEYVPGHAKEIDGRMLQSQFANRAIIDGNRIDIDESG